MGGNEERGCSARSLWCVCGGGGKGGFEVRLRGWERGVGMGLLGRVWHRIKD